MKVEYILAFAFLIGCSTNSGNKKIIDANSASDRSKEISIDKINIPTKWTEITQQNNEWIYYKPCPNIRGLFTIDITKINNQDAILDYTGLEGQWYAIKKVIKQGDSLIFRTVLPYDTLSTVIFSITFIDRTKNIVRWNRDRRTYDYIPTKDSIKYKHFSQLCL